MAYRITSYTGPDIWKYFGVLDRSRPRDVGRRGDAVIIVNGASAGPGEPALPGPDASDIIEAPDQQWIELRDRPTTP